MKLVLRVVVIHLQLCNVVILTRSQQALRKSQTHSHFSPGFVASSDRRVRFAFANRTQLKRNPSLFGHTRRSCVHVQLLQHNNVESHCHLGFQQHDPCIVMLSHVLGHIDHLGLLRHICWELTNVLIISSGHPEHPSIPVLSSIGLSHIHAKPFTAYVPNSGCIIQPPTHGLRHNTGTPVSSGTVLERPFSKEDT